MKTEKNKTITSVSLSCHMYNTVLLANLQVEKKGYSELFLK